MILSMPDIQIIMHMIKKGQNECILTNCFLVNFPQFRITFTIIIKSDLKKTQGHFKCSIRYFGGGDNFFLVLTLIKIGKIKNK